MPLIPQPPVVGQLDAAVHAWITRRDVPQRLDAALVRLSSTADHSKLWMAASVAMVPMGQRGRKAALRGILSLAVSSGTANVIGKTVFGGPRPLANSVPLARRLMKHPTSGSFPSGHSASAAAFATGATLEWPASGVILVPLAAAVCYSRIHVGAHWTSDVVGGAALGAGIAIAGKLLLAGKPPGEAQIPAGKPIDLPAIADGEGLFVVVNPGSGAERLNAPDPVKIIRDRLPRTTIHELTDGDDLIQIFRDAVDQGATAIGMNGGDGSVSAAATVAMERDVPLVVLPGGTLNHFAKAIGLSEYETVLDVVQAGRGIAVTTGVLEIDGMAPNAVLNTFSIGVYPELVTEREKHEKRWGKGLAGIYAALKVLRTAEPLPLRINDHDGDRWLLFAGVNRYFPRTLAPVERKRLDDGVLDIREALVQGKRSRLRTFLEAAGGSTADRIARRTPVVRKHLGIRDYTVADLTVSWRSRAADDAPVIVAHDGETTEVPRGTQQVRLVAKSEGLRVYAPSAS